MEPVNPLVIISTYPSSDKVINILNRCIHTYKSINYDVLVVSHLPLDQQTAKNATYTIYDSNNTFLDYRYCPMFYNDAPGIKVTLPTGGHSLPICRNMKTGVNLAKALGYKYFIFTEADVILGDIDLKMLSGYMKTLATEDKKMLFFRPEEYRGITGSYVYETLLFGGNVNYFLDTFTPPITSEEWVNVPMGHTLELSFYERFGHDENKFLIINDHSSNIFIHSDVNLMRYGFFNCEMIHNTPDPSRIMLFMMNYLIGEEQTKYITVYKNNTIYSTIVLYKHSYWFNDFPLDDSEIVVEVYSDERKTILETSKKFILNKHLGDISLTRGIFELT